MAKKTRKPKPEKDPAEIEVESVADDPLEESTEPTSPEADAESLGDQLVRKDIEISALQERLLYLQADLDNFKRRTEKRLRDTLEFASEPLLKDLLPITDNLERALGHAGDSGPEGFHALLEGLEHVRTQFNDVLTRHGVEPVPGTGEKFDPEVHEALLQVDGDEAGLVRDVFETGFRLKGRLLRPAKVSVTRLAPAGDDG